MLPGDASAIKPTSPHARTAKIIGATRQQSANAKLSLADSKRIVVQDVIAKRGNITAAAASGVKREGEISLTQPASKSSRPSIVDGKKVKGETHH